MPKDEKWKAHKRNLSAKLATDRKADKKHLAVLKAMEEKADERFQDRLEDSN